MQEGSGENDDFQERRSQSGATAGGGLESEAVYKEIVTSGPGPGLAQTLRVCGL